VEKLQKLFAVHKYVFYSLRMDRSTQPTPNPSSATLASASYAALRYQGLPPPRAQAFLGLSGETVARLERLFLARSGGKVDPMKPRFARHAAHLRAVLAEGGFPVLPGRPG
jgi:hypothetical protein